MAGPGPQSLASVFAVAAECQQRIEEFALTVDIDGDAPPGLLLSIDELAGPPELRMVKLLQFGFTEVYLALRLQTPGDGFRVAAEIQLDVRDEVGDLPVGSHTLYAEERAAATVDAAVRELRALTEALCAHTDLPARLGAVATP